MSERRNEETESAGRVLFKKVVIFCGVTRDVYSDQDRDFEYALFQEVCHMLEGNATVQSLMDGWALQSPTEGHDFLITRDEVTES